MSSNLIVSANTKKSAKADFFVYTLNCNIDAIVLEITQKQLKSTIMNAREKYVVNYFRLKLFKKSFCFLFPVISVIAIIHLLIESSYSKIVVAFSNDPCIGLTYLSYIVSSSFLCSFSIFIITDSENNIKEIRQRRFKEKHRLLREKDEIEEKLKGSELDSSYNKKRKRLKKINDRLSIIEIEIKITDFYME